MRAIMIAIVCSALFSSASLAQQASWSLAVQAGAVDEQPGGPIGPIACAIIPICAENNELYWKVRSHVWDIAMASFLAGEQSSPSLALERSGVSEVQSCLPTECGDKLRAWATVLFTIVALPETRFDRLVGSVMPVDQVLVAGGPAASCLSDQSCLNAAQAFALSTLQ